MKTRKKALLTVLCAMLLVVASVCGTLAYLTANTEVVTNTFTIGNVAIDLDEAKTDEYGEEVTPEVRVKANKYKLIPGHNYAKDPTVHVEEGSEPCWLFVKVEDGIADIEGDTTVADQITAKGWSKVDGTTNVFAYGTIVDAREDQKDVVVFENFTIKTDADVAAYGEAQITIDAYAVQADGLASAAAAWEAAPTDWK